MVRNINPQVNSWARFDSLVRFSGRRLLGQLDNYQNAILIAGCQRSGTTALSRLIKKSDGMVTFQFGKDDELDAALILSGWVSHQAQGRYCFQTTYLNDSYPEYFEHNNYKLIWVLRNPSSVIYSMLYNWKTAALNRLFRHCGSALLQESERWRYEQFGAWSIPRLRRACLSYNAKIAQTFMLRERLDDNRLLIIDYERLVHAKDAVLPAIYDFIGLPYRAAYADRIHAGSVDKAKGFYNNHRKTLDDTCLPVYEKACALINV
jgi:hypothetical protein